MSQSDVVEHRRLIIAGSGIAGLTAAVYAGRSNNEPLVFEGDEPGGQLTLTTEVDNYPGFPEGISGPELVNDMKTQARKFGAEIANGVVESVDVLDDPGPGHTFRLTLSNGDAYTADAVIAASGASARTLGIPGEDELMGYGLSTCATCDGAFFRDEFRAEDYWIDRVKEKVDDGEIELKLNTEVTELHGSQAEGVDHVTMVHHPEGHPTDKPDDLDTEEFEFDAGAVFYAIGHTPNTAYLRGLDVEMDDEGYLETAGGDGGGQTATGVPGLFGAGDVVDYHYQQAITAGGMGCKAAIDADGYLEDLDRERAAAETEEPAAAESDD